MRNVATFSTCNRVIARHKPARDYLRLGKPVWVSSETEAEFEVKTRNYEIAKSQLGYFAAGEAPLIQRLVNLSGCDATTYR